MTTLLLIRHGESTANVTHAIDSTVPGPPLTDLGRQQADNLADRLAAEFGAGSGLAAIYASTMVRTQQTAAPLSDRLGVGVQVVDGLQEYDDGDIDGRTDLAAYQMLEDITIRWLRDDDGMDDRIPGGESGTEVAERAGAAVARILADHADVTVQTGGADATVAVVTHGGVIRLLAPELCPNVPRQFVYEHAVSNTGIIRVHFEADGPVCTEWDGITDWAAAPEPTRS